MNTDVKIDAKTELALSPERLRVSLLYKQGAVAQTTGLFNACIYAYIIWDVRRHETVIAWLAMVLVVFAARLGGQGWFNVKYVRSGKPFAPEFWENAFTFGTIVAGSVWAIAGTALLPSGMMAQQAFLGFLLAGTTAGAAVAYCTSLRALIGFLLPALIPFAVRLALDGGGISIGMAILIVLYCVTIGVVMKRMNRYVADSIRLKFEKDHLFHELQETQSMITHSAKMAALGVMAGGISHEINNPLTAIRLNVVTLREVAESGKLSRENAIELTDAIDATVIRIAKIITGLKTFARDGKHDNTEFVPVSQIVSETLDFCRTRFKNHGVNLTVEVQPDLMVECRRVQISQVLINLLNNALDAVDRSDERWVTLKTESVGGRVQLSVTDSGFGIPLPIRERIMQPFFTTKEVGKGTGLGLSIALGIMQSHGGTLTLDTESRRTRFVMDLPGGQASARMVS